MFWISLILVSLFLFLYWLWPKKNRLNQNRVLHSYNLSQSHTTEPISKMVESVVYFQAGESKLEHHQILKLKEWMSPYLNQNLDSVLLVGSADRSGNLAKNRKLVKERIQNIRQVLLSLGIDSQVLQSESLEPIFGRTAEERKLFRSVGIKLSISE
ncbi:hypothetical protein EHQ74_13045 [Leptospira levettii]|uniref:Cell envelope biogenesis protein OmpA n=2 Tax=Leptospira levettii TaxID=2023178 RepID=A0ABY2MMQ7_9LEPT|nr:hypothetical protein EHQ60_11910 [Leptospira levettii]TGM25772.1 hypothetical protein EHQ74_13045 [Leptospira levettii]TGM91698.1 hypothetical protein EHR02_02405 [Leptospira levettii]